MDEKERKEAIEYYNEHITNCKSYAAISGITSALFAAGFVMSKGFDLINNTKDFESAAIMSGFFGVCFAGISVLYFITSKALQKKKNELIDPKDKVARAAQMAKDKAKKTKEHSDYVKRITKGK